MSDLQLMSNWGNAWYVVEQDAIQRDLNKLVRWAVRNLLKFSEGTCEVLHLGWSNTLLDTDGILLG